MAPPYQFEPYRSPFAQSIASLIQEPARAQAAAELQRGAAWGNAAQQIGQTVGAIPQQIQAQKIQQTQQDTNALKLSEERRAIALRGAVSQAITSTPMMDEGGIKVYDIPAIAKKLPPEFQANADEIQKHLGGINDAFRNENAAKQAVVIRGASSLIAAGSDPDLTLHFIDTLEQNRSWPKADLDIFRQLIAKDPSKTDAILRQFVPPQKPTIVPKDSVAIDALSNQPVASNIVAPTPTKASLAADLSSQDPAVVRRARIALGALADAPKPGTIEAWVLQARDLATAKNGKPLTPTEEQGIDGKAIEAYKGLSKDPAMTDLLTQSKELAIALQRAQLGQQPTPDNAKLLAQQMVDHRMAPSQIQLFGGFGTAGAAFKRMVGVEALKLDPQFDWEQAESDYQFSKSSGFQSSVRFMSSVQESIPQLLKNATALANGDVRSINAVLNAGQNQFNNIDLKKYNTDRIFVADEIAKLLQGGGTGSATSDAKLERASSVLKESDSPASVAAALGEANTLIGYRKKALTRGTYVERQTQADAAKPALPTALPPGASVTVKP